MKKYIKSIGTLLLVTLFVLLPYVLTAQLPDPGGDPDNPPAPINGLVGIALVLGACFGAGKLGEK